MIKSDDNKTSETLKCALKLKNHFSKSWLKIIVKGSTRKLRGSRGGGGIALEPGNLKKKEFVCGIYPVSQKSKNWFSYLRNIRLGNNFLSEASECQGGVQEEQRRNGIHERRRCENH